MDTDLFVIAKKYEDTQRSIIYPSKPVKPSQKDYANNADFGAALDLWEADKDKWLLLVDEYRAANGEVVQSFKSELLDALKISNHPKREKLWEMAWERGHAHGFYEIAQEAERLAELLD